MGSQKSPPYASAHELSSYLRIICPKRETLYLGKDEMKEIDIGFRNSRRTGRTFVLFQKAKRFLFAGVVKKN